MSRARRFSLAVLGLLAGCAPVQRYASSEPTYLRYELVTAAHPESVSRWYQCFALEDVDYRQLCLSHTPGVRVSQGAGLACGGGSSFNLCRAFPLEVRQQYDEPYEGSTVDDDNAGGAILEAFGRLFVGIVDAAFDSDDDRPEHDRASRDEEREERRAERRSADSERRKVEDARRSQQRRTPSPKRP